MSEDATVDAAVNAATAERAHELRKAANDMVRDAKKADRKHNRLYDPRSYITADRIIWLMTVLAGCCYFYCGCDMVFGRNVNRSKNPDAVTLERIDSDLAHTADNCILACLSCNKAKGRNMHFDVMRQWAVPIKQKVAKWCSGCQTVKSLTQFGRDKSREDGLDRRCRACNTIHCVQMQRARKRRFAQIDEPSTGESESESK